MRFIPKYQVSYHGVIHKANVPFEISPGDAEKMSLYGEVQDTREVSTELTEENYAEAETPVKKGGRPKKN